MRKKLGIPLLLINVVLVVLAVLAVACSSKGNDSKTDKVGSAGRASTEQRTIRVTGIPDENPTELQRKYEPMVTFLSAKLNAKVEYIPLIDYGAAVQALVAKKIDFAWLGGFTFVQARTMAGAVPLVQRDIDRQFKTVFIANVASKIMKMEDLKGKKFAFGSKSSTSGHLMPRNHLITDYKIDPDKDFDGLPIFTDAHDATVKLVESGQVDAGALNIEVWERLLRDKRVDTAKVVVIWTTPPYVDYVWAAGKDMSDDMKKKFADAFLALQADNPADQKILALQGAKKFVPATNADYDNLEKIGRATGLIK